jgi:kynurenine formamidase
MTTPRRRFLMSVTGFGGALLANRAAGREARRLEPLATQRQDASPGPTSKAIPTQAEAAEWYARRRNWGRWGRDDQMGAVNLITPQKRLAAAALVKSARTVSLSRNFEPEQQFIRTSASAQGGGSVVDYYGFIYHGQTVTHLDALCHVWDQGGIWNGRSVEKDIDTRGAKFADVTAFGNGIITRGVLLDVPRYRKTAYVTTDAPVHGWELAEIARAQGVAVGAGDALLVYSGREAYIRASNTYGGTARPGLHLSCTAFIRDRDVSLLGWDMMDARPDGYGLPWPVHGVIFSFGVPLLDNALLEPLALACAEERRYEFMLMVLPLKVPRGTGSPANPIAMF